MPDEKWEMEGDVRCLRCSKVFDAFSGVTDEDAKPVTGDVSLCLYCGNLSEFVVDGKDLALRPITEEKLAEYLKDQTIINALAARQFAVDKELE